MWSELERAFFQSNDCIVSRQPNRPITILQQSSRIFFQAPDYAFYIEIGEMHLILTTQVSTRKQRADVTHI